MPVGTSCKAQEKTWPRERAYAARTSLPKQKGTSIQGLMYCLVLYEVQKQHEALCGLSALGHPLGSFVTEGSYCGAVLVLGHPLRNLWRIVPSGKPSIIGFQLAPRSHTQSRNGTRATRPYRRIGGLLFPFHALSAATPSSREERLQRMVIGSHHGTSNNATPSTHLLCISSCFRRP